MPAMMYPTCAQRPDGTVVRVWATPTAMTGECDAAA